MTQINPSEAAKMREYQEMNAVHQVESASPHRLIQLLMERVMAKITLARSHMQRNDIGEKGSLIGDAIALITGLQASLNYKEDEKLAENFDALYDYMTRRLLEANFRNDPAILNEVAGLMREIKEAWDAIEQHPDVERLSAAAG